MAVHDFLSRRRAVEKVAQGGPQLAYMEKIDKSGVKRAE
jgi:hypothetical protein